MSDERSGIGCKICTDKGRNECAEHRETEEEELKRLFGNFESKIKREYLLQALEVYREKEQENTTLKAEIEKSEQFLEGYFNTVTLLEGEIKNLEASLKLAVGGFTNILLFIENYQDGKGEWETPVAMADGTFNRIILEAVPLLKTLKGKEEEDNG